MRSPPAASSVIPGGLAGSVVRACESLLDAAFDVGLDPILEPSLEVDRFLAVRAQRRERRRQPVDVELIDALRAGRCP